MKQYDRICPVCGRLNRTLYLEETGGWMECEQCGVLSEVWVPQVPGIVFPLLEKSGAPVRKAAGY